MKMTMIDPNRVIVLACREMGISWDLFRSSDRTPRVIAARMICAWLIRKHTDLSLPAIAAAMGRPNHSSIVTMNDRFKKNMSAMGVLMVGEAAHGMVEIQDAGLVMDRVEAGMGVGK